MQQGRNQTRDVRNVMSRVKEEHSFMTCLENYSISQDTAPVLLNVHHSELHLQASPRYSLKKLYIRITGMFTIVCTRISAHLLLSFDFRVTEQTRLLENCCFSRTSLSGGDFQNNGLILRSALLGIN